MAISLYTSRVILKTLGIPDFGIYNLVGGIVVLFSFLNGAMSSATQRFLNFEIANRVSKAINTVFCTSMYVHVIISFIVLILGETVGLWFLNYKLNIPFSRLYAANWVYQFSIITTIINIIRIPYSGLIIAYERMSFYAYLGIFESVMKLIIVYLLLFFTGDHLIIYAMLLMIVNLVVNMMYALYCFKNFKQVSSLNLNYDKKILKEMTTFSGWNLFGNIAVVGANQGLSLILNIFIGVTVNAALGIANQINAAIYGFVSNFQMAFNPQITQSYALGKKDEHEKLIFTSSKLSFYLLAILALPVLINTEFILKIWLGDKLPHYVVSFTRIIVLSSLIDALSGPFWMSVYAYGKIKKYQVLISILLLLNLPLAHILLKLGYSPIIVLICKLILSLLTFLYRFWFVKKLNNLSRNNSLDYFKNIFIFGLYIFLCVFIFKQSLINPSNLTVFLIINLFFELLFFILILLIGLNKNEKKIIINAVNSKFKRSK
ncbi:MATE family efflux transporter [Epilithonimonas mollis]|nr:MATE family efflux transporter [Epilithonimonas mollis]